MTGNKRGVFQTILLLTITPTVLSCSSKPDIVSTSGWTIWEGAKPIDPAGDMQALQGKWKLSELYGQPPPQDEVETYVVVSADNIDFVYGGVSSSGDGPRKPGDDAYIDKFKFTINSSVQPRVICYSKRLGVGKAMAMHQGRWCEYYDISGDTLSIWNQFAEYGEIGLIVRYKRQDKNE